MMKFSLIQIYNEVDGFVNGVWLQDHTGNLNSAIRKANETEKANSNRIKVAVVERIGGSAPNYCLLTNLKRLG
ncbi:hypothetical protein [Cytobacillus praedii]|uniref:Uncharacterized protein n=1 Tax=Cytobacillus praedii TaxID=1742358 RepID=A0A4R1AJC9_9BACI|nr:hypothetical protein [Cytobacillus praedii]TCI99588.1 hypothetical protein E0Y62_27280 [Cytobacillus praedii]